MGGKSKGMLSEVWGTFAKRRMRRRVAGAEKGERRTEGGRAEERVKRVR